MITERTTTPEGLPFDAAQVALHVRVTSEILIDEVTRFAKAAAAEIEAYNRADHSGCDRGAWRADAAADRPAARLMLWGAQGGALELRTEGGTSRLRAAFPYGAETELAPGRREAFAPRAFAERIDAGEDIHLLAGHDYDKPLASRAAGTLTLTDTDAALVIEARIDSGTSWARDFLAAHAAGLIRGLSPGFRVAPGGERIEQRGAGLLRTVTRAALMEVSAVTVPAYPTAQIEARSWQPPPDTAGLARTLNRWRI